MTTFTQTAMVLCAMLVGPGTLLAYDMTPEAPGLDYSMDLVPSLDYSMDTPPAPTADPTTWQAAWKRGNCRNGVCQVPQKSSPAQKKQDQAMQSKATQGRKWGAPIRTWFRRIRWRRR